MLLHNRLKKLEASQPEENPRANLSYEELQDGFYLICKKIHKLGVELKAEYALMNVRCRELFSDEPWVNDHNHRLDVFLKFRKIGFDRKMPKRVEKIFALGWGNDMIDKDDITWIVEHLKGVDLGEETPWLKGYLEHSGDRYQENIA